MCQPRPLKKTIWISRSMTEDQTVDRTYKQPQDLICGSRLLCSGVADLDINVCKPVSCTTRKHKRKHTCIAEDPCPSVEWSRNFEIFEPQNALCLIRYAITTIHLLCLGIVPSEPGTWAQYSN